MESMKEVDELYVIAYNMFMQIRKGKAIFFSPPFRSTGNIVAIP
jgi:hypothetical protein